MANHREVSIRYQISIRNTRPIRRKRGFSGFTQATRLGLSRFQKIANCLKLSGRHNTTANVFQLVGDLLRDDGNAKWVLTHDNGDDASFLVEAQNIGQHGQTNSIESGCSRPLASYLYSIRMDRFS